MFKSSYFSSIKRALFTGVVWLLCICAYSNNSKKIIINEFLASNSTGLVDEDGDHSDWIELYNTGEETINLNKWCLTDNIDKLKKWVFPSVSIQGGSYLVVFASGKNRTNPSKELHTNFSLSKDGEYLALIEPDGTVSDEYEPTFPPQSTDVSYGYYHGEPTFFENPTPGQENTLIGQALAPQFSVTRGFYNNQFTVTLTTNDPATRIYYTTDGTRPDSQAVLYTEPIVIAGTTPLSAVGLKRGASSQIVTHTYYFIDDILTQADTPQGYPDRWGVLGGDVKYAKYEVGEKAPAHYEMDQSVIQDIKYKDHLVDGFMSLPSISIVTNPDYLFSGNDNIKEAGIYVHPKAKGDDAERPVSIEYFEPTTGRQFQINCGLRMHGAASRQPEKTAKHSFRLYFRKLYGEGKLRYDLFEKNTAVQKFDHLVLRAGFGYSWMHWGAGDRLHSQYVVDSFAKRTQLSMGHHAAHDRFVHLFINGLYWGLYDVSERIRDKYMEAYFGGEDADYDVLNHNGLVNGSRTAFDKMVNYAKNGKLDDIISENLLAAENYIDYLLINFYMGNSDWGNNNWYAARDREKNIEGFRFFAWDTENCFFTGLNYNVISGPSRYTGPLRDIFLGADPIPPYSGGLSGQENFKLLFADRVQKHFFNNGALSPETTAELYTEIADEIEDAIILESARWGSYRRNVLPGDGKSPIYTKDDHWLPKKQDLLTNYFPNRTNVLYNQLKDLNLIPTTDAPLFSSPGGQINDAVELTMTYDKGSVYYTFDESDPRDELNGVPSASAHQYIRNTSLLIDKTMTVRARVKNRNEWSALSEVTFTMMSLNDIDPEKFEPKIFYAHHAIHVDLPNEGDLSIVIYSPDGNILQHINQHVVPGTNRIVLHESLRTGVYIYQIRFGNEIYVGKFVQP